MKANKGAGETRPPFSREVRTVPIYEYQCRRCSKVTEKIEGISDRPLSKCPSCGGKVERLMSSGAFILKGTGWYATDYANKGNGNGNGNGRGGGKGKPSPKGDSCPAASTDSPSPACAGCPKAK